MILTKRFIFSVKGENFTFLIYPYSIRHINSKEVIKALILAFKVTKYPTFWNNFSKSLDENKIKYHFLNDTSDVWAVDYMPIQKSIDDFILFTFNPIYYKYKKYQSWKTDNVKVCQNMGLNYERSSIIIDGGNVTKGENMVIMTDRIFDDNKEVSKKE